MEKIFLLKKIKLDGKDTLKLQCPSCGIWGIIDDDQLHGKVSVDCVLCSFHETHDFTKIAVVLSRKS